MNNNILKKRRFLLIAVPLSTMLASLYFWWSYQSSHNAYWQSMGRVQTVEFNLLASVAPGTIKEVIKTKNYEKAKEIVSANYCLFSISIEMCKDETCTNTVQLASSKRDGHLKRCGTTNYLEPVRIPIYDEQISAASLFYRHAYVTEPTIKENTSTANIIGYMQLSKSESPTQNEDLMDYLSLEVNGKANSSRHKLYRENLVSSVLLMLSLVLIAMVVRSNYLSAFSARMVTEKLLATLQGVKNAR